MARATIEEVAARVGVTKSTVSHALSGKRPVAPETRRRIEAAIAELGYRPSALAQGLAAGRTGVIGLAYEPAAGLSPGEVVQIMKGAHDALAEAGYAMVLIAEADGGSRQLARYIEVGLLDGALVGQVRTRDSRVETLRAAGMPFALLGRTADNDGLTFVDTDTETAVEMCVERLFALGHRRTAFLARSAPEDANAAQALRAYERACLRRRLLPVAPHLPHAAAGDVTPGLLMDGVTGLIAAGRAIAGSARLAASELGRRVPADVSLLCLGYEPRNDARVMPGVTGVNLRYGEQARLAAELVVNAVERGAPRERQVLLEPEWVEGETLAAVRG